MPRKLSPRTALARLCDAAPHPIYAIDAQHAIVYCNRALAEWAGVGVEQLIGRRVAYHSEDDPRTASGIASGLCPPPSAFEGEVVEAHVSCMTAQGKLVYRGASFFPLGRSTAGGAAATRTVGVVAFLCGEDVASTRLAEQLSADPTSDELHRELRRFRRAQHDHYRLENLVGQSRAMRLLRRQVEIAAAAGASATIFGPPGSGREHVARTIFHLGNKDPQRPLIVLDGELLDEDLTRWALQPLAERPAHSAPPTLLLRDLQSMSAASQVEVLRFCRQQTPPPQLLATTQVDVDQLVSQDRLSEELASILSALLLSLPRLADRSEDLPLITQAMVEHANASSAAKQLEGVSAEALDLLALYEWPRNLDQLREVVQDACQHADGTTITTGDLPTWLTHAAAAAALPAAKSPAPIDLESYLAGRERELIEDALRKAKGNKTQAAWLLGLTRPKLYRRLAQLGLEDEPAQRDADVEG